jgi:hypothetical protein
MWLEQKKAVQRAKHGEERKSGMLMDCGINGDSITRVREEKASLTSGDVAGTICV